MHRLIYKSILSDDLNWPEIVAISSQARKNNANMALSGMLIPLEQMFKQVTAPCCFSLSLPGGGRLCCLGVFIC